MCIRDRLFLFMFRFELTQITFDPDLAKTNGVRVHMLNLSLAILTAGTITVSMRVVGVLLVGALIVIPVLVSIRVVKGLTLTLIVSSALGVFVAVFGMVISFYADLAPGGSVVLIAIFLFFTQSVSASHYVDNLEIDRNEGSVYSKSENIFEDQKCLLMPGGNVNDSYYKVLVQIIENIEMKPYTYIK